MSESLNSVEKAIKESQVHEAFESFVQEAMALDYSTVHKSQLVKMRRSFNSILKRISGVIETVEKRHTEMLMSVLVLGDLFVDALENYAGEIVEHMDREGLKDFSQKLYEYRQQINLVRERVRAAAEQPKVMADLSKRTAASPRVTADSLMGKADLSKGKADLSKGKADLSKGKADSSKKTVDPPKGKAGSPKRTADPPKRASGKGRKSDRPMQSLKNVEIGDKKASSKKGNRKSKRK